MTTTQARTARKAHDCSFCRTEIPAGHRYLVHVGFPGEDGMEEATRPWRARECVYCGSDRGDTDPLLLADACGTFCCGDTPCARPFKHDNDWPNDGRHSCRRCVEVSR